MGKYVIGGAFGTMVGQNKHKVNAFIVWVAMGSIPLEPSHILRQVSFTVLLPAHYYERNLCESTHEHTMQLIIIWRFSDVGNHLKCGCSLMRY